MESHEIDSAVRAKAFAFLEEQTVLHGEVLPRGILTAGFDFEGRRVPLLGPQGIFKPALLSDIPLSITTVPVVEGKARPYEDEVGSDGLLRYRYRGIDPMHRDNVGLRLAMRRVTPLVYLYGIVPGHYMPVWPVYIVGDSPGTLTFTVAVDDHRIPAILDPGLPDQIAEGRRAYVTGLTLHRLHQQSFRIRVLRAYQETCAVCRLRQRELLEASHILPDTHPRGAPIVPNGIALCTLHHAAFDRHILGIRPDYVLEIRSDVLNEKDGPMLLHGLQGFQNARLHLPRHDLLRPNPDFLAERYELFRRAM